MTLLLQPLLAGHNCARLNKTSPDETDSRTDRDISRSLTHCVINGEKDRLDVLPKTVSAASLNCMHGRAGDKKEIAGTEEKESGIKVVSGESESI